MHVGVAARRQGLDDPVGRVGGFAKDLAAIGSKIYSIPQRDRDVEIGDRRSKRRVSRRFEGRNRRFRFRRFGRLEVFLVFRRELFESLGEAPSLLFVEMFRFANLSWRITKSLSFC